MDFVREILEPDKLVGIVDLPAELRNSKLEVIILPFEDFEEKIPEKENIRKKRYQKLYENPIKVEKIRIPSRAELHER